MADLTPVSPGEDFRFLDADVANALLEVARAWRNGSLGRLGGLPTRAPQGDPVSVVMQNRTGSALDQYAIVGISDALVPYATSATEFKRRPQFRATAPSASAPFAVLQQPLANWVSDSTPNTIGRAIISGCTVCKLNVTASGDTYAAPTTSTTELTTQATPGPARILAKQSGTGAGKWGIVLINNVAASSGTATLDYTGQYLQNDHTFSAFATWEEVADWEGVTGVVFPSTGIWRASLHLEAGALEFSATNTAQIRFRVTGISAVSEIVAPDYGLGSANAVEAYTMAGWDSANSSRYDGCTIPIIVDVSTANVKGLLVEARIDRSTTGFGSASSALVVSDRTWIEAVKIG